MGEKGEGRERREWERRGGIGERRGSGRGGIGERGGSGRGGKGGGGGERRRGSERDGSTCIHIKDFTYLQEEEYMVPGCGEV